MEVFIEAESQVRKFLFRKFSSYFFCLFSFFWQFLMISVVQTNGKRLSPHFSQWSHLLNKENPFRVNEKKEENSGKVFYCWKISKKRRKKYEKKVLKEKIFSKKKIIFREKFKISKFGNFFWNCLVAVPKLELVTEMDKQRFAQGKKLPKKEKAFVKFTQIGIFLIFFSPFSSFSFSFSFLRRRE